MAAADRVVVDLGTGDGRAAVGLARRDPTAFVIGLDASAAAMAETSRRAARAAARGGLPNLLFAVAAAELPPAELCARADEVTVLFPWGSLLRGALAIDPVATAGIAGLVAPGGNVRALVSVAERDAATLGVAPMTGDDKQALARRWAAFGLTLAAFETASDDDIEASGSTWARRLLAGRRGGSERAGDERIVWQIELRRAVSTGPIRSRGRAAIEFVDRATTQGPPPAPPRVPRPRLDDGADAHGHERSVARPRAQLGAHGSRSNVDALPPRHGPDR